MFCNLFRSVASHGARNGITCAFRIPNVKLINLEGDVKSIND